MKTLPVNALVLLTAISLLSCTKDVYKRPITIDQLEFANKAGQVYQQQFQQVNAWYLQKLDSLQAADQRLVIDTTAKKKYHKYNYTLVASLHSLDLNGSLGVYYQLYLQPNSGIGKIKGGVQHDMYNELKLYSPASLFQQHGRRYYQDSVVAGATTGIIPVHVLYKPENMAASGIKNFEIEGINFFKGLKKKQQHSLIRIINNAIVLRQQRLAQEKGSHSKPFNYYAPWLPGAAKTPPTYALTMDVTEDILANKITLKLHYKANIVEPKWLASEIAINRRDFLDGYYYEADNRISGLVNFFVAQLAAAEPQ
ncbi:hypothetical protein [Pontibacter chitinilyticus]|uniref:hypothetical protein n=1 Tax=Pontibacter chitinilyticus TaxID=2674989 RepID=UPI003219FFE8